MKDLDREAAPIIELLRADLLASVKMSLDARVRWIAPEEQQAEDAAMDFIAADPKTVWIGTPPHGFMKPLTEYEGYWALELPRSRSMIHDATDVIDLVQEDVIEALWQEGRSASWPECPEHGGHPLDSVFDDEERLTWRCPRDPDINIPLGGLRRDGRFGSA